MHVQLPGFKPRLIQLDLVIRVVRIDFCGLQVVLDGGVIILQILRMHPRFVVRVALRAASQDYSEQDADGDRTPSTHEFSGTPSGPKSRLYLPLQSSIRLGDAASAPRPDVLLFKLSHLPALSNLEDLRTGSW